MPKTITYQGKETNYVIYEDGRIYNNKTQRFLKGTNKRNEYTTVQLTIEGKPRSFLVHRLVAQTFLPNPENFPIVHHKNRNKKDNRVENLEWISYKDNVEEKEEKTLLQKAPEPQGEDWKVYTKDPNYLISKNGQIYSRKRKSYMQGSERNGYRRVNLGGKLYSVHIIVYETFVGPVKGVIDHIDGNKSNNALENLRDITQSENMLNAQRNGHKGQVKIRQLDENYNLIKEYRSFSEAAREFGVTYSAISSAARRKGKSCGYFWEIINP